MKKLFIILVLIFVAMLGYSQKPCPTSGNSPKIKLQALDTLKNRNRTSSIIENIKLSDILAPGDDENRFNSGQYVSLMGYVFDVKHGKPETCNCKSSEKNDQDIHIEIVMDLKDAGKTKIMVIEINRYTIASFPDMNYENIHALIGKHIQFDGWLFFDIEHKQNAFNMNPTGSDVWRATCWECHPVMHIKILNY